MYRLISGKRTLQGIMTCNTLIERVRTGDVWWKAIRTAISGSRPSSRFPIQFHTTAQWESSLRSYNVIHSDQPICISCSRNRDTTIWSPRCTHVVILTRRRMLFLESRNHSLSISILPTGWLRRSMTLRLDLQYWSMTLYLYRSKRLQTYELSEADKRLPI